MTEIASVPGERGVANRRGHLRGAQPVRRQRRRRDRRADRRRRRGGLARSPTTPSRSRRTSRSGRAPTRSTTSPSGCRDDRGEREPDRRRGRQAAEVGDGRGDPCRLDVPVGLRDDPTRHRRGDAPGHRGRRSGSRLGLLRRFPLGPVLGITPVQLPAEPGGAQGGALARGRSADRGEARQRDADRCAPPRRVLRRDRPAQGHVPGAAGELEGRRRHGARRPVQEDLVHGIVGDRLVPQGPRPEEARDARARRQRRRDRAQRRRPGLRRAAHRVRRLLPGGTELHQRAAGARRLRGLRRLRGAAHQAGGVAEGRRPDGPDRRRRSGDPAAGGRAHPGLGRRGRQPGRRGAHRRHRRGSDLPAHADRRRDAGDEGVPRGGLRSGRHDQPRTRRSTTR